MAETLRELVVALPLDSSNFLRSMLYRDSSGRGVGKQVRDHIKGVRERTISQEELERYRKKLDNPKIANRELGHVLLLLDREIYAEKAEILGRMYAAVVDQSISWEQFLELSEALDPFSVAWDDPRSKGGMVRPENYDWKPGFAGKYHNFCQLPEDIWNQIKDEIMKETIKSDQ